jgi:hypothetical protein
MGWPVKSSSLAGGLFYFKVADRGDKTLRGASGPATKAFYPALSLCDMIFSGVFERHPRLRVAIVEFELAWPPRRFLPISGRPRSPMLRR